MALLKPVPTRHGIPANYWRIVTVSFDEKAGQVSWTLSGYFTEAARWANGDPIGRTLTFTGPIGLALDAMRYTGPARGKSDPWANVKRKLYGLTKDIVAAEARDAKAKGQAMPLLFEAKDG